MEEKNQNNQVNGQAQKNSNNHRRPRHHYNKNKDQRQNNQGDRVIKTRPKDSKYINEDGRNDNAEKVAGTDKSHIENIESEKKQGQNTQQSRNKKQSKPKQFNEQRNSDNRRKSEDKKGQGDNKNQKQNMHNGAKQQKYKEDYDVNTDTKSLLDSIPDNDDIFGKSTFSFGISNKSSIQKNEETKEEEITIPTLSDEELFGISHMVYKPSVCTGECTEIVGVKFKSAGKVYYFDPDGINFKIGENAILDTARGLEFGEVNVANKMVRNADIIQPLRKVIRKATEEDIEHYKANRIREAEAFKICLEKIENHKLDMKLVEVQYAFDNSKLLFYFTSAGRVDFRELVRDLASVFKTRIELRQIGIRDEAKMLGGIGVCGRPLCCSKCFTNFAQVSIKMAKEQGLSLNSNKISGNCGRLMCCLNYENQVYVEEIKKTPMQGSIVKIGTEKGTVIEAHPLTGILKVHLHNSEDGESVTIHRDNVITISKKSIDQSPDDDNQENIENE